MLCISAMPRHDILQPRRADNGTCTGRPGWLKSQQNVSLNSERVLGVKKRLRGRRKERGGEKKKRKSSSPYATSAVEEGFVFGAKQGCGGCPMFLGDGTGDGGVHWGCPAGSECVESSPSSTQGSAGGLRQKNCFLALKAIHKPLVLWHPWVRCAFFHNPRVKIDPLNCSSGWQLVCLQLWLSYLKRRRYSWR